MFAFPSTYICILKIHLRQILFSPVVGVVTDPLFPAVAGVLTSDYFNGE
jgi:hypothetical protein